MSFQLVNVSVKRLLEFLCSGNINQELSLRHDEKELTKYIFCQVGNECDWPILPCTYKHNVCTYIFTVRRKHNVVQYNT